VGHALRRVSREPGRFNERSIRARDPAVAGRDGLYEKRGVSVAHCAFNNYGIGQRACSRCIAERADRLGTMVRLARPARHLPGRPAGAGRQQQIVGTPNHIAGHHGERCSAWRSAAAPAPPAWRASFGCLAQGKRADVILALPDQPDQQPVYDPLFTRPTTCRRDVRT